MVPWGRKNSTIRGSPVIGYFQNLGNFSEEFFGRNSLFTFLKSAKVFEYEWNLCFCQDFGVMKERKEGS
jgi:hypothetical protein